MTHENTAMAPGIMLLSVYCRSRSPVIETQTLEAYEFEMRSLVFK